MGNGVLTKSGHKEGSDLNVRIERLLKCFDSETQKELLDFCRKISETQADVYFLMARKASCFFYCLEELGLISFNGYVTSERILDMDTSWLCDKEVIIIDDAIVSGTSINRTINRLVEAKAKSIKVYVLSVNKKWFQPDMITDNTGKSYLYPNCNVAINEQCISLCYRVVKSILLQPRPYDIDFPLFNRFDVKSTKFSRFINLVGWNSYDVSTLEQLNNEIYSVTFIPTSRTLKEFELIENCSISNCALIKIRTYITHKEKNKDFYSISVLPMVVFDKVSTELIEEVFSNITKNNEIHTEDFSDITSKLRLVQFYYSYKLALFWNTFLPEDIGVDLSVIQLEQKNLRFIFPPEIDSEVKELCRNSKDRILPKIHFDRIESLSGEYKSKIDGVDYISTEARLIEPFLDLYYNKEIPCRQLVLEKGKDAFEDEQYQEILHRLNKGISVGDLLSTISYVRNYYDCVTKVSLFIDRSVDMGIIVPITQTKDGFVFRAFRHGEDVLFGEKEETLYSYFLYEFQEESNKDSEKQTITHIAAEKLIVLFTELGIKKEVLSTYLSNFVINPNDDNSRILRIKTYLKGPVAIVATKKEHASTKYIPYITTEDKSTWLTQVFSKKGLISEGVSGGYRVNKPDTSAIGLKELTDVQLPAVLLGRVCNEHENTGVVYGDQELTKIATCLTRENCIKAVAAELNICKHKLSFTWEPESKNANDKAYEALNSAFMKLRAFETGEAAKLIRDVKFESRSDNINWMNMFSEVFEENTTIADETLKEDLAALYYRCKYATIYLLCSFVLRKKVHFLNLKKKTNSKAYADFFKLQKIEDECIEFCDDKNKYIDEFSEVKKLYDNTKKQIEHCYAIEENKITVENYIDSSVIKDIYKTMSLLLKITKDLLDDICCVLGRSGKLHKLIRYNQVLYLSYKVSDYQQDRAVRDNINTCMSYANSKRNDAHLLALPEKYNPDIMLEESERAVWFIAIGNAGAEALAILTLNLSFCLKEVVPLKFTYLGDIENSYAIKERNNSNGEFICNSFYDYAMTLPSKIFFTDWKKNQITIVLDKSMEKNNRYVQYVEDSKTQRNEQFKYKRCECSEKIIDEKPMQINNYESRFIYRKSSEVPQYLTKQENNSMEDKIIGIITIIEEETRAVEKVLQLSEKPLVQGKRLEYEGKVGNYHVIMTQCLQQGEQSVISAFSYLMKQYKPDMICLVGIAGGINDDVNYTSVVLAEGVVGYDLSKETENGICRRGKEFSVNVETRPLYQAVARAISKKEIEPATNSIGKTINITIGDIASGSAVIKSTRSKIREWINTYNDKILACEMEAWGFTSAFYESKLNDEQPGNGICIIRGVSDMADEDKSKEEVQKYRQPAAENAAIVLRELISIMGRA